ncbi:hypothetical protein M4R22_18520 [Acidovorax sp. GBBC 3334]|uniref:hypothetical protein n=1 Tax=Acidovorax sp. GBBC 3334 TaxID=2940496 RepID=UPI002303DF4B|nr:hypothetical protein [Acidovorax sp. GBBC 3334]MDA8456759.1 hypothetical protein [Acidovorax sp. GBBC 3334]
MEAIMLRVAPNSPDAHLRLLQLYIYPRCTAFDLDKASAQIPLLTQCAHLTLGDYLERAESANYPVSAATRKAISDNMDLCKKELAGQVPPDTTVQEFLPVRKEDVETLSRRLAAL